MYIVQCAYNCTMHGVHTFDRLAAASALTCAGVLRALLGLTGVLAELIGPLAVLLLLLLQKKIYKT